MKRVAGAGSAGLQALVEEVGGIGDRELRSASSLGTRLVDATGRGRAFVDDEGGSVTRNLAALRRWAEELRPSDDLGSRPSRRRFGILRGRDPGREFESHWDRAQGPIEDAVNSLRDAAMALRAESAVVSQEQVALMTEITALTGYAHLTQQLDVRLSAAGDGGADRDLLYAVRRRRQEILTQLAVAQQGYAALRVIADNNAELIAAVNNATTTTIAAMQAAAVVRETLRSRQRLHARLEAAAGPDGRLGPGAEDLRRAWAAVSATLLEAETLRRRALEAAAAI